MIYPHKISKNPANRYRRPDSMSFRQELDISEWKRHSILELGCCLCCMVIFGQLKRRKCISKILYRHISNRIYLYCSSKSRHHNCPKTVNQPLYHKDSKIHDRLLQAGQKRHFGIGLLFMLYGYFRAVGKPGMSVVLTICSLGTRVALAYINIHAWSFSDIKEMN